MTISAKTIENSYLQFYYKFSAEAVYDTINVEITLKIPCMSSAIKLFLIVLFFPLLITAQDTLPEPHRNQYVATDPETVFLSENF